MDKFQYWDDQAVRVGAGGAITDNFWKRQALIKRLLDYDFWDKRVFEIGCGAGVTARLLKALHAERIHYVGTDISRKFCAIANKSLGLNVVWASDPSNLPFEKDTFDALLALDVLEHVPNGERGPMYAELNRILKPNARVFINNPLSESKHNPDFEHSFNDLDLIGLCEALGMRIERLEPYSARDLHYQFIVLIRGEASK